MDVETKILVNSVVTYNSIEKNIVCCIEEMSELTKVLTKKLRNSEKFKKEDLLEEVAHVLLMCNAIVVTYDLETNDILEVQKDAVKRMEEEHGIRRQDN